MFLSQWFLDQYVPVSTFNIASAIEMVAKKYKYKKLSFANVSSGGGWFKLPR